MRIKHLLKWRGFKLDLHQFVGTDAANCFHTHPARALRLIVWGGYVEQLENASYHTWRPGRIGLVSPSHSHRISELVNGAVSYSLWFRWPKTHEVRLRGDGWPAQTT